MEADEDDRDVYLSGPFDASWVRKQHRYTMRGTIHAVGVLSLAGSVEKVTHLLLAFALPLVAPSTLSKGMHLLLDGVFLVVCNTVKVTREADETTHAYYAVHITVPAECANTFDVGPRTQRRVHIELLGPAVPDGRIVEPADLYVNFQGLAFTSDAHRAKAQVALRCVNDAEKVLLPYAAAQYRAIAHVVPIDGASVPIGLQVCTVVLVRGIAGIVAWVAADESRALVWFPPSWPHSVPPELGDEESVVTVIAEPAELVQERVRRLSLTESRARHFMQTALALGDAVRTRSGAAPWTGVVAVDSATGYELAHGAARAPQQHQHPTTDDSTDDDVYIHPECVVLQRVIDIYDPRANSYSVELFTTHEPCYIGHGAPLGSAPPDATNTDDKQPPTACSDFITLHENIIARVVIGSFLWSKSILDMPLVRDFAAADAKRNHTAVRLPSRIGLLDALDNELYKEVWWQLREYRHWAQSNQARPYVIALVCESLNGCTIDRTSIHRSSDIEALTTLLQSVTCLATAIVADRTVTAGQQPSVFSNVALFDPPLTIRGTGGTGSYSLPLRVMVAGPSTFVLNEKQRQAYFMNGQGQPLILTTAELAMADMNNAIKAGCAEADYRAKYWGTEPTLTLVPGTNRYEAKNAPDDTEIMAWLARQGIISIIVECSGSGFIRLAHQRLVDEVMFVRLPVVQQRPSVLDVNDMLAMARVENEAKLPEHELGLVDSARVGDTNIQFAHYIVHYQVAAKK